MCLVRNKKHEDLLLQERNPEDWVIVWKLIDVYSDGLFTPYQGKHIKNQTIIANNKKKVFLPLGHSFSNLQKDKECHIIDKGAIHVYKTKKIARSKRLWKSIVFKAYAQVKDIVGVGTYDVATRKLILDDNDWKKFHEKTR